MLYFRSDSNGTGQMKQIDENDMVGKFRLVVETTNFMPIFGNGGEGKDIVQIEVEGGVYGSCR